jgi:hypothetical protein
MARIHFGHCIGCDQPIRPPYLTFKVMWDTGQGITEWEEVDVCSECAAKLTVEKLFELVTAEEEAA